MHTTVHAFLLRLSESDAMIAFPSQQPGLCGLRGTSGIRQSLVTWWQGMRRSFVVWFDKHTFAPGVCSRTGLACFLSGDERVLGILS